jgi:RimJ/RimL family protein N-acetyltransferase
MLGREPKILAEIERGNEASIYAIENAGFVKARDFDRYGNGIWALDWTKIGIV